ncbi:LacI family DNA-binding transcriptional regulator [Sphaerotilus mobilis]|uniref:LacI family transcriptional regulator n=1 Tax=Sphaerotilus mobilis TaxID=47994 RepID=A0A4V2EVE1_9BURK|nr:LacI family DNA-binding transcriptional regulator [Sphaerotilus mobilis]RZS52170.1 LacI family transcriptional regulator [Sphaerotilus mobilis]
MSTIRDVARLAGVGVATASRALSGNGSVAEDTILRVRDAAERLDYRPSSIARALSLRRSGAIGVYVPSFDAAFYSSILSSVDEVLRAAGRHMIASNGCGHGSLRQEALDGIDFLLERDCDGLLIASHSLTDDDLAGLLQRRPRTVVVNRMVAGHEDRCFSVDHEQAGVLAARTLMSQGHREIATIAGPDDAPDNVARMRGFYAELARHDILVRPEHQGGGTFMFATGDQATRRLLPALCGEVPGAARVTAIFIANDLMAMASISCLTQAGLRVPEDVSVLGYDDSAFARYTSPPLTTVRVPITVVSADGCRMLLNECYDARLPVQRGHLAEVVWRGTVAAGPHPPTGVRP